MLMLYFYQPNMMDLFSSSESETNKFESSRDPFWDVFWFKKSFVVINCGMKVRHRSLIEFESWVYGILISIQMVDVHWNTYGSGLYFKYIVNYINSYKI